MHTTLSFEYATVRLVPRPDREEFLNAGVILLCLQRRFLHCRLHLDEARLQALWPAVDLDTVRAHLLAVDRICNGIPAGGPIAQLSIRERFHWLTAPRSTIVQPSPVRTGTCLPDADLELRLNTLAAQLLG